MVAVSFSFFAFCRRHSLTLIVRDTRFSKLKSNDFGSYCNCFRKLLQVARISLMRINLKIVSQNVEVRAPCCALVSNCTTNTCLKVEQAPVVIPQQVWQSASGPMVYSECRAHVLVCLECFRPPSGQPSL